MKKTSFLEVLIFCNHAHLDRLPGQLDNVLFQDSSHVCGVIYGGFTQINVNSLVNDSRYITRSPHPGPVQTSSICLPKTNSKAHKQLHWNHLPNKFLTSSCSIIVQR